MFPGEGSYPDIVHGGGAEVCQVVLNTGIFGSDGLYICDITIEEVKMVSVNDTIWIRGS